MADEFVVPPPAGARDDGVRFEVSLTLNADCVFTIRQVDPVSKEPVDWDDVSVCVFFRAGRDQHRVDATVNGADAVVRFESELADTIKTGAAWQAIRSVPGDPSLELPLMVGRFVRSDGDLDG